MVPAAVAENASWCDVFCRAHGITGAFGPRAWTSPHRTPEYYPDAVTLAPTATAADILPWIDASPGCTVKDSFATLDLSAAGFSLLFEATWIACGPGIPEPGWHTVSEHEFPIAESVRVLTHGDGAVVAHRGRDVVGLSNFDAPAERWPGAVAAVSSAFPGKPVVGYEHGETLEAALAHGAKPLGPLRVWLRE